MKDEKRTILIVDDEEMVLDVEALMLERMDFKTLKANSSQKAYQLYRDKKDNIDLVILDMIMPGDNGAVIYKKLKRINSGIRVLISSGTISSSSTIKIVRFSSFIPKLHKWKIMPGEKRCGLSFEMQKLCQPADFIFFL